VWLQKDIADWLEAAELNFFSRLGYSQARMRTSTATVVLFVAWLGEELCNG